LAIGERHGDKINLRVQPAFINDDHPLARISGPFNGVSLYGHAVGHTMYYGRGAGALPTASAITSDIISVALGTQKIFFDNYKYWPDLCPKANYLDQSDVESEYYLRLSVKDSVGVTATITRILAENNISIEAIYQKPEKQHKNQETRRPIVILLDKTTKGQLDRAINGLANESTISSKIIAIPVIEEKEENIN
jgi:homoserine dehydrogenase